MQSKSKKAIASLLLILLLMTSASSQAAAESNAGSSGILTASSQFYEIELFIDRILLNFGVISESNIYKERISESIKAASSGNLEDSIKASREALKLERNFDNQTSIANELNNTENGNEVINQIDGINLIREENQNTEQENLTTSQENNFDRESDRGYQLSEEERRTNDTSYKPDNNEIKITVEEGNTLDYVPDDIKWEIDKKLRIIFENNGENPHSLYFIDDSISPQKELENVNPGESRTLELSFTEEGDYGFYSNTSDDYNRGMRGIIEVN